MSYKIKCVTLLPTIKQKVTFYKLTQIHINFSYLFLSDNIILLETFYFQNYF